jgi:hypothetical protein
LREKTKEISLSITTQRSNSLKKFFVDLLAFLVCTWRCGLSVVGLGNSICSSRLQRSALHGASTESFFEFWRGVMWSKRGSPASLLSIEIKSVFHSLSISRQSASLIAYTKRLKWDKSFFIKLLSNEFHLPRWRTGRERNNKNWFLISVSKTGPNTKCLLSDSRSDSVQHQRSSLIHQLIARCVLLFGAALFAVSNNINFHSSRQARHRKHPT